MINILRGTEAEGRANPSEQFSSFGCFMRAMERREETTDSLTSAILGGQGGTESEPTKFQGQIVREIAGFGQKLAPPIEREGYSVIWRVRRLYIRT